MDYEQIHKDILELTDSDIEAAKAVSMVFDAEEKRKADEEAEEIIEEE